MTPKAHTLHFDLKNTDYPAFSELKDKLVSLGYTRVGMVLEPGEFSVRGNIVDIFASGHSHPIRIEYFDDEIDRLCSFSTQTQRSLSQIQSTTIEKAGADDTFFFSVSESELQDDLVSEFSEGDYVVHDTYGIGQFKGLIRLKLGQREGEFFHIQYRGNDKLYVPIDKLHLVNLYSAGSDLKPALNGLHDGKWTRTKNRVKKATLELAEDVYRMAKLRQTQKGFQFKEDSLWQIELEDAFEHEATADQQAVTQEVKADMESSYPMDRLICGDVGYGKTEILVRAAFKAVENEKQVAILVPTTLLAEQHLKVFKHRIEKFPYRVEGLSRFQNKKKQAAILEDLKAGKVDIVIGTHRLLSKDVGFRELGLVIVDEEQRFGVKQKEKIKEFQSNVDILSVSATPIPRTLYLALTGSKELSNIQTPPKKRKPILTHVSDYDTQKIKQAVKRELDRGGQVFYLFNDVQNIYKKAGTLKRLLPKVSIGVGHGQMPKSELQSQMTAFRNHDTQVFVCTTIVESGLDIPSANTIIIENCDQLGLSQIHQVRGRVGRTTTQAYAYLFYRDEELLTGKAKKRLKAIKEYAALGSGYKLAAKDLEIRGAGSLLGHKQHGQVTAVGFDLYCRLLADSVNKTVHRPVKATHHFSLDHIKECYIPDSYIESSQERMGFYRRISKLKYKFEVDQLIQEMQDRYGEPPQVVYYLFEAIKVKLADF